MVKYLKIGKLNFTFVFRHKFEKETKDNLIDRMLWKDYALSIWFRNEKMVGKKDFKIPSRWDKNLVNSYMIGINLILCKMWVEFNRGGMIIKEK